MDDTESIISTRQRRSNAGNKLKSLLAAEGGLDDDEIFIEVEGDEEFDPNAIEQDQIAFSGDEQEEEEEESDTGLTYKKRRREYNEEEDENFSSSSESSDEEESDEEAGEKEFQTEERLERRKTKKRLELPFFKKPAAKQKTTEPKPKKPKVPVAAFSENLLAADRRVSKRSSAVRNKQQVIQRLQEQEARRAEYVAPVIKKQRAMTQAERLEEAKITEQKNIASLNQYVEQEEIRKQKQRAAMLARRVPMKCIIRYISSTKFIPPRRIFIRKPIDMTVYRPEKKEEVEKQSDESTSMKDDDKMNQNTDEKTDGSIADHIRTDQTPAGEAEKIDEIVNKTTNHFAEMGTENASSENNETLPVSDGGNSSAHSPIGTDSEAAANVSTISNEPNTYEQTKNELIKIKEEGQGDQVLPETNRPDDSNEVVIKSETPTSTVTQDKSATNEMNEKSGQDAPEIYVNHSEIEKTEIDDSDVKAPLLLPLHGPYLCRMRNTVNLLGFPSDFEYSRQAVKSLLFGAQSLRNVRNPKTARRCPVTGKLARYVDPSSNVAYANMEAFKVINLIRSNQLNWSPEFGGVFTGLREGHRHATGVPSGFDN